MTEQSASERALSALKAIGMQEAPIMALEREDALFVLTGQTLVYQDGGGTRRVTLRDLTRIHSDEQGVLRVETPAGTALTASLLGFDVGGVQGFFAQVRDTTARAKELPASPLPTPDGLKTFGTPVGTAAPDALQATPPRQVPPAQPPERADRPTPVPPPRPEPRQDVQAPRSPSAFPPATPSARTPGSPAAGASQTAAPESMATSDRRDATPAAPSSPVIPSPASTTPAVTGPTLLADPGPTVSSPTPIGPAPIGPSSIAPAAPIRTSINSGAINTPPPAQPVVISSSAFTPQAARTASLNPAPTAEPKPVSAAVPETVSETRAEVAPAPGPAATVPGSQPVGRALAQQADVVDSLVGRLRFLGGVLFVAALGLAAVQFTGGSRLDGLWTLLSGGVGTIALLALAELARLLALIGRAGGATDAG